MRLKKKFAFGRLLGQRPRRSRAQGTTIFLDAPHSLEFELIKTFTSYRAAAKYFNSGEAAIIKYALSRKIFRKEFILSSTLLVFQSDFVPTEVTKRRKRETIYVFSLEFELLLTFPSSRTAAKQPYRGKYNYEICSVRKSF